MISAPEVGSIHIGARLVLERYAEARRGYARCSRRRVASFGFRKRPGFGYADQMLDTDDLVEFSTLGIRESVGVILLQQCGGPGGECRRRVQAQDFFGGRKASEHFHDVVQFLYLVGDSPAPTAKPRSEDFRDLRLTFREKLCVFVR